MLLVKENLKKLDKNFIKALFIIHNDMDGRGCEILGRFYFPDKEIDYVVIEADEGDSTLVKYLNGEIKYDLIIMADLSFKNKDTLNLIEKYIEDGNQFYLIDHHKTALGFKDYEWAYISSEIDGEQNSGTELLYHFLNIQVSKKDEPKEIVELIRSYDTWDWFKTNNTKAKDLVQLFEYDHEAFVKSMLDKLKNNKPIFSNEDLLILKVLNNCNETYAKKTAGERYDFVKDGHKMTLVLANQLQGLVANEIFKQDNSIEMIVFLVTAKKLSFRSTDEKIDTLIYSKGLGGGGHRNASGCALPKHVQNYIEKNILNNYSQYGFIDVIKDKFSKWINIFK